MRILIATPCMDMVATGFCQSLATLKKVGDCAVMHQAGSLVYDSRNAIAKRAIEMKADYVMWFDSDMIFAPDTLEKLVEDAEKKGCDIVSGLYFRRQGSYRPVLFKKLALKDDNNVDWEDYLDYPKNSLFEVKGIGFGCVLIKTDVLIEMAMECKDWFTPVAHAGEDLAFCLRAQQLGRKIWCDSSVKCGHVGHTIVTEEFYESFREFGRKEEQS